MNETGFFIIDNHLISIVLHIYLLCDLPKAFGLTEKEVTDTFEKYNERIRTEGIARQILLENAIKNGILRIRRYETRNNQAWSINVYELCETVINKIYVFTDLIVHKKIYKHGGQFEEFRIWEMKSNKTYKYTAKEILENKLLKDITGKEKPEQPATSLTICTHKEYITMFKT